MGCYPNPTEEELDFQSTCLHFRKKGGMSVFPQIRALTVILASLTFLWQMLLTVCQTVKSEHDLDTVSKKICMHPKRCLADKCFWKLQWGSCWNTVHCIVVKAGH